MTTITHFGRTEVVELVSKIHADQTSFDAESRVNMRQRLVLPLLIQTPLDDSGVEAFTRNISNNGVCIIAPQPYRPGTAGVVQLKAEAYGIPAVGACCWCKKFGLSYWISGWALEANLPVGKLLKDDGRIDADVFSDSSLSIAVPATVVRDRDNRTSAFTRYLSPERTSLVSQCGFKVGKSASVQVRRLNGESSSFDAVCEFSKQLPSDYWISSWRFGQ